MGTAEAKNWSEELKNEVIEGPVLKDDTSELGNMEVSNTDTTAGKLTTMYPEIHENNYIDNTGIAVGSLPHDSYYSVVAYAKSKFPDMDPKEAIKRFGQVDGRIYYLGNDQKLYWATPNFSAVKNNPANLDEWMLRATGPAIPIVSGTAGALASYGNPVVAGASGMAGEGFRQGLSHKLTGEELPIGQRAIHVGSAGLIEGGGQLVANKLLNPVINKVLQALPSRIKNFKIGDRFQKFNTETKDKIDILSKKYKIPLTHGEASGDPRLIKLQKLLANKPNSDEILNAFYNMRNGEVKDAIYKLFVNISEKEIAPDLAFKEAISGSQAIIKGEERILIDKAKAFYNKAFQVDNVDVGSTINLIDELIKVSKGNTLAKLHNVKSMLYREIDVPVQGPTRNGVLQTQKKLVPETNLQSLDQIKREIDQILNSAGKTDTSIAKGNIVNFTKIKESLLGNMDNASSDYAKARQIYEHGVPNIDKIKGGFINQIAKQNENMFADVGKIIFNSNKSSVADVKSARELFFKHGKGNEWNQLVRGHLENVFESVIKDDAMFSVNNLGGSFYKKVFGTKKQRDIMLEAFKGIDGFGREFADVMTLLNQTIKAMDFNSDTAWKQMAQKEFMEDAKPFLGQAIETLAIWNQPERLNKWWTKVRADKLAKRMAYLLTTPEGKSELAKLREIGPKSKAGVILFTHILGGGSLTNVKEKAMNQKDVEQGEFKPRY
jgi:hypothetical protein